jgi:putative ABC transport system permease protein
MKNILKIAIRNLFRYKRRTYLTSSLIAFGVIVVIVFSGLAGSFKNSIIGILTDSVLADLQIHKQGYVASIDNLPLNVYMDEAGVKQLQNTLEKNPHVAAFSPRIKFGAMISNYAQTSAMRLTAVNPDMEARTCQALTGRIKGLRNDGPFLKPGEIIVPKSLMKGLALKLGDEVVLVANNKDGSVNGATLRIAGIADGVMGPQGKDGYVHLDDAKSLLRIEGEEISEIAVRVKNFNKLKPTYELLQSDLNKMKNPAGQPHFEIHTWAQLSPFSTIARMIDLLIMMVRVILISIVLISVLNIMMMSVYERTSEIGTIAALGTPPRNILMLFLSEGLLLGILSTIAGTLIGICALLVLNINKISFTLSNMKVRLSPDIPWHEVLLTAVIVVAISGFASWQPANKASKLEPVDALRHV